MKKPKSADIEAAKAYLRDRLSAEQSMDYNLSLVFREAAERIVGVCYSYGVSPQPFRFDAYLRVAQREIDDVIQWLIDTIEDYFQTLAIADHKEDEDEILPLIFGVSYGATFNERLSDYANKYKHELELLIGAGLFLGVSQSKLLDSIVANLKHPFANEILADAIDAPITYGKGHTNSMYTAISNLTRFGIATAWMHHWYQKGKRDGAVAWYVQRGSSYPCSLCDSKVGVTTNENDLPPFHNRCMCYATPLFI